MPNRDRQVERETMIISACDIFECEACAHRLRGHCLGCAEGSRVLEAEGGKPCAVYQCVVSKQLISCKDCSSAVCQFPRALEMVCPVRAQFEKKRCYARKMSDHFRERQEKNAGASRVMRIPEKTITRLRWYLFALDEFLAQGISRGSSDDISHKSGVKDYLIRHDLSLFGEFGRPSIGYDTAFLRDHLAKVLHLDDLKSIVWVGADRLANDRTLMKRFEDHGFKIVGVFDEHLDNVPAQINGLAMEPLDGITETIRNLEVESAVLAVAEDDAQTVVDLLIGAGIRAILNLTSAVVVVPTDVCVRNVDVVAELFALSYYSQEAHHRGKPPK